ncbi:DUF4433 domain-containing protein [Prosthecochloris sp. HL-130-GSB]|uniref:type II toxin-antitoxin system toxin DNA ADP-ribosyl transferase DarT n=1 Tax=Prosthecochloris sp. HL-130-GSB TaxID=1974213 RepID=UPI000A1C051E|nr:DUF4433 domain-containing protein [Prosthecochloris sp. HL-130-GSB]ARM31170.1 hypothetical protein B9H02_07535 [Prosthecochloris sp. HL-130-GSB]
MSNTIPANPKIFHIVHVDRLASIVSQGCLYSDAAVQGTPLPGTTIGMSTIKARRLAKTLNSYPSLHVGDCVPFYFCPRSVMLYMFHMNNHPEITYHGGQTPIVHLQADLYQTVKWANQNEKRWVFTNSNAGSFYFDDFNNLSQLNQVNWSSVDATNWKDCREQKQAEFLIEEQFPWSLVEAVGVYSQAQFQQVSAALNSTTHRPPVSIQRNWYY